ncbi:MAG: hypothetical protein ABSG24_00645 [Acidimicrobiales bacterium]|jgi:hypothetical protein
MKQTSSYSTFEPSPSGISDDELTALALAADPHATLDLDAVPWNGAANSYDSPLPEWYMPRAMAVRHGRATRVTIIVIIAGFLLIDAFGLCVTSGFVSLA